MENHVSKREKYNCKYSGETCFVDLPYLWSNEMLYFWEGIAKMFPYIFRFIQQGQKSQSY